MNFLFGMAYFQGRTVSFGEGRCSIFFDLTSANPCKCWFLVVLLGEREWDGWVCFFWCGSRSVMLFSSSPVYFVISILSICQCCWHVKINSTLPCFWCLKFQVPAFQLTAMVFLHSTLSFGYTEWCTRSMSLDELTSFSFIACMPMYDDWWCMFFNNTPLRVHLASLQAERVTAGAFHPTSTSCSPVERVRPRATSCSPGRTGTAASTSWERTDLRCVLGPANCCAAERRTGRAGGGRASGTTALPSASGPVAALNAAQCGADGDVKAPWTRWIDARLWKVI